RLFRQALDLKLVRDARHAVLARELARPRLGVARFGELAALRELVEQRGKVVLGAGVPGELARELGARVLAAGEQPDGAVPQGGLAHHPVSSKLEPDFKPETKARD